MSDEDRRFKLSRRRLLGGLASVGAASTAAGAGTFAYFQDSETSSGNSVTAGYVNLKLHNGGGGVTFSIGPLTPDAIQTSGDYDQDVKKTIDLENPGSLRLDHVDVTFSNDTIEDNDGDPGTGYNSGPNSDPTQSHPESSEPAMAKWIYVDELVYDPPGDASDGSSNRIVLVEEGVPKESYNGNTIAKSADYDGQYSVLDDFVSLADLELDTNNVLSGFTPPESGSTSSTADDEASLTIALEMHPEIPNDYQGDVLETDVQFDVEQAGQ